MKLTIRPASAETLAEIGRWRYDPPYDFYDGDGDPVLNPERFYEAIDENGAFVGHFYFEEKGGALEIGLGLEFLRAGMDFGRQRFRPVRIILNVAAFNGRAIKVYERAGFRETGRHMRSFKRWGDVEFVEMEESAEPL